MNCCRPFFSAPSCTALLLSLATIPAVQAASVSAGNLVIYRVGTGAAALSTAATAVFLEEYTTGGAFVQSIPVALLDTATQQNAALVEESAASAATLKQGALSMSRSVEVFQL
jgi:hypothetical protein